MEHLAITLMDWIKEEQDMGKLPKPLKIAVWENAIHRKGFQKGVHQKITQLPGNFELVKEPSKI